ncbi:MULTISPECIES: hypothetical protein [Serratia]|jgi:hypothetical protein|uniref:hypothetical protein n=1 Tax=Serratia TaxID=613 RepID=UPI00142EFB70|nr:hypothetical protein [Serratia proteamaculans]
MMYAIAGQSGMGCSTNFLLKMQHHKSNILTSASFTPPPRKSLLDKLVEFLRSEGNP